MVVRQRFQLPQQPRIFSFRSLPWCRVEYGWAFQNSYSSAWSVCPRQRVMFFCRAGTGTVCCTRDFRVTFLFPARLLGAVLEYAVPSTDTYQLAPLLERSAAGDARAFNDLLATLRPYLHARVRAQLGPDSMAGLGHSSLVQESLLRISQGFGQLKCCTPRVLLGWAKQIVSHVVIDALRRLGRRPRTGGGSGVLSALSKGLTPQQHLERDETAVRIANLLDQLPDERQRQVIQMRFLDGLSDAEIAQRLGGSAGAVRVLRCRALQAL